MHYDLLEMVNIDKLWGSTESRHASEMDQLKREGQERGEKERHARLKELEDDLKEVAAAYLGKMGRVLVDKELGALGGRECLQKDADVTSSLRGWKRARSFLPAFQSSRRWLRP